MLSFLVHRFFLRKNSKLYIFKKNYGVSVHLPRLCPIQLACLIWSSRKAVEEPIGSNSLAQSKKKFHRQKHIYSVTNSSIVLDQSWVNHKSVASIIDVTKSGILVPFLVFWRWFDQINIEFRRNSILKFSSSPMSKLEKLRCSSIYR